MKRLRAVRAALVVACAAALAHAGPASATPGYVSRSGTQIVSPSGAPLKLNGVNLGGYLLWEGWVFGGGMDAETPMYNNLASLVGATRAAQFRSDLRTGYVTAADFTAMRAMGFNTVRIPFNYRLLSNDAGGGFATLDRLISDAERAGVYVVLDMHAIPGGQSWGFIADPSGWPDVWSDASARDRTVQLWQTIAARYANRGVIAGYDLINEPWAPNPAALMSLYGRIIAGIRAVDPNHMVIIEGNQLAHDFTGFSRIDENLAYSFHMYAFDGGDLNAKLDGWLATAQAADVPLWNGEYGQSDYATLASQAQRFASRSGLDGQALWTWKQANRNRMFGFDLGASPAPVSWAMPDTWAAITRFMSSPTTAPRPTAAAAETGLQAFMSSVAKAGVTTDPKVAAALASVAQTSGYAAPATLRAATAAATAMPATAAKTKAKAKAKTRTHRKAHKPRTHRRPHKPRHDRRR